MNVRGIHVPAGFARAMTEVHGDAGTTWLARLPAIVDEVAGGWHLEVAPPFEPLSYNYVAPARRSDGTDVVLKIGYPCRELLAEIDALRAFDGRGSVRLLEFDRDRGALLLERLIPGTPLSSEPDDRLATAAAARVMEQLWRPVPSEHAFASVATWGRGFERLRAAFNGGSGPFPVPLVDAAEQRFAGLLDSMAEPVLLHGDLHHENIVAAGREPWLALDPKGVIGEPAYEAGALLRNPWPGLLREPHPDRILRLRVDQLADELGIERSRIAGWGFAQAVLSAWWSWEDHGHGWQWGIACAEILERLG